MGKIDEVKYIFINEFKKINLRLISLYLDFKIIFNILTNIILLC